MKRTAPLVATLHLVAGPAHAAPVQTDKGAKALLFTFSGLSDMRLDGFQGGIGFRDYLKDGLALRPAAEFSTYSNKSDTKNSPVSTETSSWKAGLSLALEKHRSGFVSDLSPYYGLGAGVALRHQKDEYKSASPSRDTRTRDRTSYSAFALAGFEWGFADGLTFGGEYRVGVSVEDGKDKDEQVSSTATQKSKVDVTAVGAGVSTASLFLSIGW